jgi:hypothetical protein
VFLAMIKNILYSHAFSNFSFTTIFAINFNMWMFKKLHLKVIMFDEGFKIKASHLHLLWKAKDCHIIANSCEGWKVGYYKGSHIMLKPCGHNLCYEPILSLTIVWCFNYAMTLIIKL